MTKRTRMVLGLLGLLLTGGAAPRANAADELEKLFAEPPQGARPRVMWMWMGCNLSKGGITRDLEALQEAGFGGSLMFSLSDAPVTWSADIGKSPTPGIIAWTAPWWDLVRHAASESKRLGLDFGMFNGPGYETSGGPWITPELSMQEICWSETPVSGPIRLSTVLVRPTVDPRAIMPWPVFNSETGTEEKPEIAGRKNFYRDIAVLALPATGTVARAQVIDLSDKVGPDGRLDWEAPAGQWIIYRFGHTTLGALIFPAQWKAIGLECDKMNPEAVAFHLNHVIDQIKRNLGSLVGDAFTFVHLDSYEAGTPSWTPKMREEFSKRRGYELTPFLATFAKRTIGGDAQTSQFKADFEDTIRDLHRDAYFATTSRLLRQAGLIFSCEPYGGPWRPDDVMPYVHRVVVEFWSDGGRYRPLEVGPTIAALRKSGQNIVEAEAFSAEPRHALWNEYPAGLKPIGDAAFCDGINRFVLHRFAHQPWDERYKPGITMGQWGTHFDRTQTWWEPGKAMFRYWQRCQALLQWGKFDSDGGAFRAHVEAGAPEIRAIGRRNDNTRVFFVANLAAKAGAARCEFRVEGLQPELWDPVSSERRELLQFTVQGGKIFVPLEFAPSQSWFVVFRKPVASDPGRKTGGNFPKLTAISEIGGPWEVGFDPRWGGIEKTTFATLEDWTKRPEAGIRYYSGTAVYGKRFDLPQSAIQDSKSKMFLDLGQVNHIARVRLNGKDLGVVWTAPWRVDITNALRSRDNHLEIEVSNVWANRLIGDEQEPPDCLWAKTREWCHGGPLKEFPDWFLKGQPRPSKGRYCFTTWNYFTKDSPLVSSGLLGPVTLQVAGK